MLTDSRSFLQSANYRPGVSDGRAFEVNTGWTPAPHLLCEQ